MEKVKVEQVENKKIFELTREEMELLQQVIMANDNVQLFYKVNAGSKLLDIAKRIEELK